MHFKIVSLLALIGGTTVVQAVTGGSIANPLPNRKLGDLCSDSSFDASTDAKSPLMDDCAKIADHAQAHDRDIFYGGPWDEEHGKELAALYQHGTCVFAIRAVKWEKSDLIYLRYVGFKDAYSIVADSIRMFTKTIDGKKLTAGSGKMTCDDNYRNTGKKELEWGIYAA